VSGAREYRFDCTGNFGGDWIEQMFGAPALTAHSGRIQDDTLQKAYSKLGKNEVGIGESIGEIRETLNTLIHPFKSLRDLLTGNGHRKLGVLNQLTRYLKTGTWRSSKGGGMLDGKRAAKAAANSWLELRYGLMPLVYTIQDSIDLANRQMVDAGYLTRIHSCKANGTENVPFSFSGPEPLITSWIWARLDINSVDEISSHASVQFKLSSLPTMADLLGLSPKFLPELMWELTRLSFVVDWWFDVGQWLGAMRFTPQLTVLGNTSSIKIKRSITVSAKLGTQLFPGGTVEDQGPCTFEVYEWFDREVDRDLPLLPTLNLKFDSYLHTVDALALILQPLLKKIKR
jgi:hypothetical protein